MATLIADWIQQNRGLVNLRTGQEKYTTEAQREKNGEIEQSLKVTWDTVNEYSICTTGVLEKERENEAETMFVNIMAKNFRKPIKDINLQVRKKLTQNRLQT